MIRNRSDFLQKLLTIPRGVLLVRPKTTPAVDVEKIVKDSAEADVLDDEAFKREEEISRKRNKSRLKEHDRKFLFEENPYPEPTLWHHGTLKYVRRLYGRYGEASGVDPAICWPVKEELQDSLEYEKVAFPYKISEVVKQAEEMRREKREKVIKRQEEICKKLEKLETWKKELHDRVTKKDQEAKVARERKERLIEEVRRHFGFKVDPKDDRFKELLEKKEKEQNKIMKEARKKAREEQVVQKLLRKDSAAKKSAEVEAVKNE